MTKPPRRSFNGRFPAGPYIMTVVEAERRLPERAAVGSEIIHPERIELIFRLDGTDAYLTWSFANTQDAKWSWADLGCDFTDIMTTIVGRTFLVRVGRQKRPVQGKSSRSDYINKVLEIMCEYDNARAAHERADSLAQRTLGEIEPMPGESPSAYRRRMEQAERAFRLAHPEWQPEELDSKAF